MTGVGSLWSVWVSQKPADSGVGKHSGFEMSSRAAGSYGRSSKPTLKLLYSFLERWDVGTLLQCRAPNLSVNQKELEDAQLSGISLLGLWESWVTLAETALYQIVLVLTLVNMESSTHKLGSSHTLRQCLACPLMCSHLSLWYGSWIWAQLNSSCRGDTSHLSRHE